MPRVMMFDASLCRQSGNLRRPPLAFLALWGVLAALLLGLVTHADAKPRGGDRVLIYSGSTGYRHASIEPAVAAITKLVTDQKLVPVHSEDPAVFSADGLKGVAAIVLVSTSTDPKNPESEWFRGPRAEALQAFVRSGGGIVAIHAAGDSHYHWPWYGHMIGGHFARHPQGTPTGTVTIEDDKHPSTKGLPQSVSRTDEWYYFDDYDPRSRLLATLDPQSIGEKDVNANPMSWSHEFEGGRVFYTAMGHTNESFTEPFLLKHLAGGIRWAVGR